MLAFLAISAHVIGRQLTSHGKLERVSIESTGTWRVVGVPMGKMVFLRCGSCGYAPRPVTLGGGMATSHDEQRWPIYCQDCQEILNPKWNDRECPNCKGLNVSR